MAAEQQASGESERRAIAGRAGIVALGTLASRFLGLGREIAMAAMFTVAQTDAFWIAFTLPNALRQLLAEGAVTSAVIPVMARVRERDGDEGVRAFFSRIRGLSLLALLVATALGVAFAPQLVALFAGGLQARPEQMERTVLLTRAVFPYIFFMGTAALGMAALNTYGRFAVSSFAPALLNVPMIAACFGLPVLLGSLGFEPALALAAGALVGGALQVIAQWPALRRLELGAPPRLDLRDRDVREVVVKIGPMMLGLGIYYVDLIVCRRLLSEAGTGAQSYFSWAQRLCDFPQGIFVMALQSAAMPSLAKLAAKGDKEELGKTFAYGMRLALFVAVPVTTLFLYLAEPIVVAMFQRGHFQADSAHQTALALEAQAMGIWAVAAVRQLVPMFFVLGDTRTPVIVSGLDLLSLIAIAYALTGSMGHVGVGWAVSGSSIVQMALLWLLLQRKLPKLHGVEIASSAARVLSASFVAGFTARAVAAQVASLAGAGAIGRLWPAAAGGTVFGLVFLVVAWTLRSPELRIVGGGLLRKLRRRARLRPVMNQKSAVTMPRVVEASFAAAAGPGQTLLAPTLPEIAFAGRSNVGKSTLMNALLQRRNLVRTSSTPGCTRTVNMFHCRCADGLGLYLVDLPGFGYAKRSRDERKQWGPLLEDYLSRRPSLRGLVLLVDVRRGVEEEERDLIEFMEQNNNADRPRVPIILAATKIDKLSASQRKPAVAQVSSPGLPALGVSGEAGLGIDQLWKRIRRAVGVLPEGAATPEVGAEKTTPSEQDA